MAVGHYLEVPELAGHAVRAAEDPVVDHEGAADAGSQGHAQHEAVPDAGAEPALGEGRRVGVVVHDDGQADA